MKDKIVLDLETKKSFDDVGGYHNTKDLGVSVTGVYSYDRDEYRAFRENEMDELKEWLLGADLIIGFNSKSFDFTVLQPYYKNFDLSKLPHLDIMEEVVFSLGHRLKLETIAQATLGRGKSGHGLDAIKYFNAGDWESLEKYCLDDVKITKEIYDYGMSHGYIWYTSNSVKEKIGIRWAKGETVSAMVQRALSRGLQLEIDYINDDGEATTRKIDIQSVNGSKIMAFCHLRNGTRKFDLTRIKKARDIGSMDSFQNTLL